MAVKPTRGLLLAMLVVMISFDIGISRAWASGTVRTVALSGMQMPGSNESFADVGYFGVSLNNRGETSFVATPSFYDYDFTFGSSPTTSVDDESVWTEAGGSGLRRIVHEAVNPPSNVSLESVARPIITDVGDTIFNGSFLGQGAPNWYWSINIFRDRYPQGASAIAGYGANAPGTNVRFGSIVSPSVNSGGGLAFYAALNDLFHYYSIWASPQGGPIRLVARRGDTIPGIQATFNNISETPVMGDDGHVTFTASLMGDGVDNSNDETIWLASPARELTMVVREGDHAPAGYGDFRFPGEPSVGVAGRLAFTSGLSPAPGGGSAVGKAVWRYQDEELTLVAIQGQQAPGLTAIFGTNHINLPTFRAPVMGDNGHLVFFAELLESNQLTASIWVQGPHGSFDFVAREGDPAPGTSEQFVALGPGVVNARGQVAFAGRTVDLTNRHYGIWAQDQHGVVHPIALAGELLDVSSDPGHPDLRTIEFLSASDFGDFGSLGRDSINDLGQVAFFARFTDGTSGIFVSDAVAVPEPAGLAFLTGFVWTSGLLHRSRTRLGRSSLPRSSTRSAKYIHASIMVTLG